MKKVLLLVAAMAAVVSWSLASAAGGSKRYALLMSHMSNAFTIEMATAVQNRAKELKADLTVFEAGQDVAKQIGQIESAVAQGYAAILIEPVSVDGVVPAIAAARKAGVVVVTVNQKIAKQEEANAYVGANPVEGGELEMETAAKAIGGKGNVAFLLGPMGSDAQLGRTKGYENVIKSKYPGIKVVYQQTANWRTDEALKLVENWLQTGTKIDAVVANNDGMALGALKAVEDARLGKSIKVYGLDATPDALQAVADGRLAATISQSTTDQGRVGMETAYKIVNGEKVKPEVIVAHTLITRDNVAKFMKK
ncbi:MAG TPA: substrate-binding domain-containing protein [Anaeromyxobacteraceae bacterium]|nr:substrate-binding domain-containing protein [Anaeromyxobacteraceae bacterium]